jgi:hypothetical protein
VWLAAEVDTIASATWTVPAGLTQETSPAPSHDDEKCTVWLSAGTPGETYTVTSHITTAGGRIDERSFPISIIER